MVARTDDSSSLTNAAADAAVEEEQPYLTRVYERLDEVRRRTADRLAQLYRQRGGTPQAVWDREAFVAREVERLSRLNAVDRGLCFGRLDLDDGHTAYIGRIGLSDENYEQLLVDWRAPAAEPFYRATPAEPGNVVRRRHLRTRHRRVLGVDDEVFRFDQVPDGARGTLRGEAALLATLDEARTGRMSDIVATIQAEQDRIIRSPLAGTLVVQGGPGTGKTVAALHRAAYLLYTHRDRLSASGVLVVGPNRTFLRYIEQVLPSLGETGVVLATVGELYPAVSATHADSPEVAVVKGDLRMADAIRAAVRNRQQAPDEPMTVLVEGTDVVITPGVARRARTRARRSRRPHNAIRHIFVREVLTDLASQLARRSGVSVDEEDLADLRADLAAEPDVHASLDRLWPVLTPEALLRDIYAAPHDALAGFDGLTEDELALLRRPADAPWTSSDVPLLDEAAELLGEPERPGRSARDPDELTELELAERVVAELDLAAIVDPELVAQRYRATTGRRTVADTAASDRAWAFGHVIVDEAQELSPMAWRTIMRRVPGRSMTVVGDIAQTSSAAGATTWDDVLDPHVADRWRLEELTVNYRTPSEVMTVAAAVLATVDPQLRPPASVRSTGQLPWSVRVPAAELEARLSELVSAELEKLGPGRMGVIVPAGRLPALYERLAADAAEQVSRAGQDSVLDVAVTVLTVGQAKGLEFDTVLVVEPAQILAESGRPSDLYVAVTRTTRRLGVVHSEPLPEALSTIPAMITWAGR